MKFFPLVIVELQKNKLGIKNKIKSKSILKNAVESKEGYVILQCLADNIPTGRILAFYGRTLNSTMTRVLGGFDNSADAKKACVEDYKRMKEQDETNP